MVEVRKGQTSFPITREAFHARYQQLYFDQTFDAERNAIGRLEEIAWQNYLKSRKAPRTTKAGPGFADPEYRLSDEWRATRDALLKAEAKQKDPATKSRVLVIVGSSRNDGSCPGEISKTFRLVQTAEEILHDAGMAIDRLDLSLLTSDYARKIYPCKACVSTAMPLCHWPCSCYPNHALGEVNDWMAEIYERFVSAHGVMIVTPVYWDQAPGGYFKPYATSHEDLDKDEAMFEEVRNVARSLARTVTLVREGRVPNPDEGLSSPRQK